MKGAGRSVAQVCSVVVMAAGSGRRLGRREPKVMLSVAGQTLLARHRAAFASCGFRKQYWVLGHEAADVRAALERTDGAFEVVLNRDFRETGSGYSLMLGLAETEGAVIFMDADLLYDAAIFHDFAGAASQLLYASRAPDAEAVKVYAEGGRLRALRKGAFSPLQAAGESVGMVLLADGDVRPFAETMRGLARETGNRFEWEEALERFAQEHPVRAVRTERRWVEIDFPGDLIVAEKLAGTLRA